MWNRSIFWLWSACFPRSVDTEYIKLRSVFRHGWNANISCPWNQIISVPAEPQKRIYFSLFHSQYTGTCLQQWEGPLHSVSLCADSASMTMKNIFKLIILLHDALNPARPRACKDQTRFKLLIISCCNDEYDELHCDELWQQLNKGLLRTACCGFVLWGTFYIENLFKSSIGTLSVWPASDNQLVENFIKAHFS